MSDEARLLVRIEASANKLVSEMKRASDVTKQRMAEIDGQFKRANVSVTEGLGRAGQAAAKAAQGTKGYGFAIQNASYQVGDFAVQIAGGTSASRAFAQQLPQLLGGLGLFGALAGAAAAIAVPLAASFFATADNAKAAADAIDEFAKSVEDLSKFNEVYSTDGIQAQIDKYGELNAEVLLLIERQRTLKVDQAMSAAEAAVAAIGTSVDDLRGQLTAYDNLMSNAGENPSLAADAAIWAESIQEEFGLTIEAARTLVATMDSIGSSTSTAAAASAMSDLAGQIEGTTLETVDLKENLIAAEQSLRELANSAPGGGWLNAAIDGAISLTGKLWEAVAANEALARSNATVREGYTPDQVYRQKNDVYSGRGGDPRQFVDPTFVPSSDVVDEANALLGIGGGRGGGGGGGGRSGLTDEQREAQRVIEATRTDLEQYNIEQAKYNSLLEKGLIDTETHTRAMKELGEKYLETGTMAETLEQGVDGVSAAMADALVNGGSLREGLSRVFAGIATDLATSGIKEGLLALIPGLSGAGGGGGGFLGSLLSAFTGGGAVEARATGGPVNAGRPYIVGEKRPELFVPNSAGRIIPSVPRGGNGGGYLEIAIMEGDMFAARVDQRAQGVSVRTVKAYDRSLPSRVQQIARDPRKK